MLTGGVTNNVYQGKLKETDQDDNIKFTPVVIKKLVKSPEDNNTLSKFINEALLMKKLKHKNIMNLVGVLLRPNESPFLILPFMRYKIIYELLFFWKLRHTSFFQLRFKVLLACHSKFKLGFSQGF